jgi:hypothetical protein
MVFHGKGAGTQPGMEAFHGGGVQGILRLLCGTGLDLCFPQATDSAYFCFVPLPRCRDTRSLGSWQHL